MFVDIPHTQDNNSNYKLQLAMHLSVTSHWSSLCQVCMRHFFCILLTPSQSQIGPATFIFNFICLFSDLLHSKCSQWWCHLCADCASLHIGLPQLWWPSEAFSTRAAMCLGAMFQHQQWPTLEEACQYLNTVASEPPTCGSSHRLYTYTKTPLVHNSIRWFCRKVRKCRISILVTTHLTGDRWRFGSVGKWAMNVHTLVLHKQSYTDISKC